MPEVAEVLNLVSQRQLVDLFGKTTLTITTWRQKFGLPYVRVKGETNDSIRYRLEQVIAWARENKRHMDPEVLKQLRKTSNS